MKKNLRLLAVAALGAAASLGFTSCYYDPAYGSTSVGASYSNGYGQGYGYGGSGFSTSVFVSTGNPQWGYDPYCYSYYDYRRRAYYDPYLNGYYPVGYRPPVVYGVPHPHGWRTGSGYIRPPVYVKNVTVTNYQNRAVAYQSTNYGWAKQVRQQPATQGRTVGNKQQQQQNYNGRPNSQQNNATRPSGGSYNSANKGSSGQATRQSTGNSAREQKGTLPSRYNSPVSASDRQGQKGQAANNRQQAQRTKGNRAAQPPGTQKGKGKGQSEEEKRASRYR